MTSQLDADKCHSRLRTWMRVRTYRGHQHGGFSLNAHWRMHWHWQRLRSPRCSRERLQGVVTTSHEVRPRLQAASRRNSQDNRQNDMTSRFGLSGESSRAALSSSTVRKDPRATDAACLSRH
jgi:hypothetical protein